jgi:citrate lyase synthetase
MKAYRKIALVPLAAKPYHAGHHELIKIATRENDEVLLFVSIVDRERKGEFTISGEAMKTIWKRYLEKILPDKVLLNYCGKGEISPVGKVYKTLEDAEAVSSTGVYTIYSDDKDILKYTDKKLTAAAPCLFRKKQIKKRGISRQKTVSVSGTKVRELIKDGNLDEYVKHLPKEIQKHGQETFKILRECNKLNDCT